MQGLGFNSALSSLWGGLSPHLIATFYEVDKDGQRKGGGFDKDGNSLGITAEVKAPLMEANLDVSLNWSSPFESAGVESKAPALIAMLQSGSLQPFLDSLPVLKGSAIGDSLKDGLKGFEGRTGITKLNSTQVFSGMSPAKIQVTALLRAWKNPISEVEEPFDQLMQWLLPQQLAEDMTLAVGISDFSQGKRSLLDALLPSHSPVMIGMFYKGRTYSPLVVESISQPIDSPIDKNGSFVSLKFPMTLSTLTALDKNNWKNIKRYAL